MHGDIETMRTPLMAKDNAHHAPGGKACLRYWVYHVPCGRYHIEITISLDSLTRLPSCRKYTVLHPT